ncbi:MAG: methyltransferase [Planctomycetota bacterium]
MAGLWTRQGWHAVLLALLVVPTAWAARRAGHLDPWFAAALGLAVLHQGWVWICWRLELFHHQLSARLGPRAFRYYGAGFVVLVGARVGAVWVVCARTVGTLAVPAALILGLSVVGVPLLLWLSWSVRMHFGFARALGQDHFDPAVRARPFVRAGIHRFLPNAMYVAGPLVLWLPALWTHSGPGLLLAAFNHAYLWVHYGCTERPDLEAMHKGRDDAGCPPPK